MTYCSLLFIRLLLLLGQVKPWRVGHYPWCCHLSLLWCQNICSYILAQHFPQVIVKKQPQKNLKWRIPVPLCGKQSLASLTSHHITSTTSFTMEQAQPQQFDRPIIYSINNKPTAQLPEPASQLNEDNQLHTKIYSATNLPNCVRPEAC